ncbi:MAG: methionyl-tRNA formyltransferase, partial [Cytophagaceae bacterium]|nr:methionyl-tRNA formyltransferase [Cytophagaceae bacterium]
TLGGERIKLLGARVVAGPGAPGAALDDGFTIACGEGAVQVTRAQRAGKGAQEAETFLRGMAIPRGTVLGAIPGAD